MGFFRKREYSHSFEGSQTNSTPRACKSLGIGIFRVVTYSPIKFEGPVKVAIIGFIQCSHIKTTRECADRVPWVDVSLPLCPSSTMEIHLEIKRKGDPTHNREGWPSSLKHDSSEFFWEGTSSSSSIEESCSTSQPMPRSFWPLISPSVTRSCNKSSIISPSIPTSSDAFKNAWTCNTRSSFLAEILTMRGCCCCFVCSVSSSALSMDWPLFVSEKKVDETTVG